MRKIEISSFGLHILAMVLMLIDHLGHVAFGNGSILRGIGRLSFPIFAFMLVEGYFHTKDIKKYISRLFIFALISEIPFDLMNRGTLTMGYNNVLWTLLIGLILICISEFIRTHFSDCYYVSIPVILYLSYMICPYLHLDYGFAGVWTVLAFYYFRGNKLWNYVGQFICMLVLNGFLINSRDIVLFGFDVHLQIFGVLSLLFIWLYKGKQGYHAKWFKHLNYWFYPVHQLILAILFVL